ncbi:class I SAM-dependent methyltransferase [Longitalea arenae]|uniref:class I SAM-dependent methyltransferase n=1 Tax=Longitalea arenae TaxID=2812558 RepID=UPI001967332C|nr:class I SAM-dependent methyltransferase [Longitalea arenae]
MSENNLIKQKANDIYNEAFNQYHDDIRSVLCANQQRQYLRFAELLKYVDHNDASKEILEVGCGSADLYKYLNFNGYRGKYTGYDINENLLNLAKAKYVNVNVELVDILESKATRKFDYVLMSGVFNVMVGQDMNWIRAFVTKMFELCTNHIAFNALSTYVNFKDDKMFYIDPFEIARYCTENLSKRVTLLHHNLPYNYTLVVFKDQDLNTTIEKSEE